MLFPEDVFNEILSFYPIKKHFHFHKISGNTELHTLIHQIGTRNNFINNTTELDRLIKEYRLTDNNYLQTHSEILRFISPQDTIYIFKYIKK